MLTIWVVMIHLAAGSVHAAQAFDDQVTCEKAVSAVPKNLLAAGDSLSCDPFVRIDPEEKKQP